jgi:hypothetical protein
MKAIEFVVRTPGGANERGVITGEAFDNKIVVDSGKEISLHLQRHEVSSYSRDGDDLSLLLADGRVLVIEGYFVSPGENENRLFVSSNNHIVEIDLVEGGDGILFAQYE